MAKLNLKKERLEIALHFRCSKQALKILKKHTSKADNIKISDVIRYSITLLDDGKKET